MIAPPSPPLLWQDKPAAVRAQLGPRAIVIKMAKQQCVNDVLRQVRWNQGGAMLGRILRAFRRWPRHPIDQEYGIETSIRVPRWRLRSGSAEIDMQNVGYVGSQPSIVRRSIETLPDIDKMTFIDLGCGKGRVLAVATEYPFRAIVGLEIVGSLVNRARKNAAIISRNHPNRTRITISRGDATCPEISPDGPTALFLYNPFFDVQIRSLIRHLVGRGSEANSGKIFVIYCNPVASGRFDENDNFERFYADRIGFSEIEMSCSPFGNDHEAVVIWQTKSATPAQPLPNANQPVKVVIPNLAADIA